jgi:uncharacterized damage-inducible protein DinB
MRQEQIMTLFNYHWSTTERLLDQADQLSEEEYHASSKSGLKSAHQLLFHILVADHGWRIGLETGEQRPGLEIEDYADIAAVRSLLAEERQAWGDYLAHLSDDDLNSGVKLKTLRGHERIFPLWHVLVHLVLHGMQHHSELAQLLSEEGLSPGNIDFIFFSG